MLNNSYVVKADLWEKEREIGAGSIYIYNPLLIWGQFPKGA